MYRSSCTHARGRGKLELADLAADLGKVAVGEHQANVADHHFRQAIPLVVARLLDVVAHALLHERVLAHEHDRVKSAQRHADVGELLRADIVRVHEEGLRVLGQNLVDLLGVGNLLVRHGD